jgi:hypothetical protein
MCKVVLKYNLRWKTGSEWKRVGGACSNAAEQRKKPKKMNMET